MKPEAQSFRYSYLFLYVKIRLKLREDCSIIVLIFQISIKFLFALIKFIMKQDALLENNRQTRKKAWQVFVDDMTHKCSRIDLTFEEKEEELVEFYSDLERKLHIHK